MALQVVGPGFGRTGTMSLKLALEALGFGPCHHMLEVRENEDQLQYWQAAARGEMPDWDRVFANYRASVDWPSARFWREIAAHFPDAKVVLSVRPQDRWLRSIHSTIYPSLKEWRQLPQGYVRDVMQMANEVILEQTFDGKLGEAEHALAVYRAHNDAVRREIAPERLLVYDVAEGWAPLCAFLGVGVPDEPFPATNTTREFQERFKGFKGQA